MNLCLQCGTAHNSTFNRCPTCGFQPKEIDGFLAYAPEFAYTGGGFEVDYFAKLAQLEEGNFWFQARNALILWMLQKYCRNFHRYLEVGCGTGYVLTGVAQQFPGVTLTGSEIFTTGLHFAAQRVTSAHFMQMDARRIPFIEEFDVVGIFDVLEHIQEDMIVLAELNKVLKPRGYLLLTVPQHTWLWSPADEYARHERRYSAKDIHQKLKASGFIIKRSTSFVSLLLPLMLASRWRANKNRARFDPENEFRLLPVINEMLYRIMSVERCLIQAGLDFSVGGSRLILAQKWEAK